jgi:hypothetical protein
MRKAYGLTCAVVQALSVDPSPAAIASLSLSINWVLLDGKALKENHRCDAAGAEQHPDGRHPDRRGALTRAAARRAGSCSHRQGVRDAPARARGNRARDHGCGVDRPLGGMTAGPSHRRHRVLLEQTAPHQAPRFVAHRTWSRLAYELDRRATRADQDEPPGPVTPASPPRARGLLRPWRRARRTSPQEPVKLRANGRRRNAGPERPCLMWETRRGSQGGERGSWTKVQFT